MERHKTKTMKFIDRFGEIARPQPTNNVFNYKVGDVVLSSELGLCMIQGYGVCDNQYWCETGLFYQGQYCTKILRLATETEKRVFVEKYVILFKSHVERFYPKNKEPKYYTQHMKHLRQFCEETGAKL